MTGMLKEIADPFGLLRPERAQDPYPIYARLHREAPVHFSEAWNGWVVVRYADVNAGLRDPRLSSVRTGLFSQGLPEAVRQRLMPLGRHLASWMLFQDAPAHTRLRSLINKAFTPRMVEALRPRVRALVAELLEPVRAQGRMEVIASLANPLPIIVIGEMLGVPREDRHRLKHWSDHLAGLIGAGRHSLERTERAMEAILEFEDYFRALIAQRRLHPGSDLLSALVHAEEQGSLLSEQELLSTCTLVLFGGHETTTNLIGNGLLALLRHPEQWELLRGSPELLPGAVEELLRYDPPVQFINRIVAEDLTFAGHSLRKGERVIFLTAAANRDPSHFAEPDRLDVRRPEPRHLALGMGPHYCLGAPLARLEAQEAFAVLLRQFPRMEVEAGASLAWHDNVGFRGLRALPVVLGPAA